MKKLFVLLLLFPALVFADVDTKDGASITEDTDMDGLTGTIGGVDGGGAPVTAYTSCDFDTFTKVDASSKITAETSTRITWVDMDRDIDSYKYKVYSGGEFDGDFTFRFTVNMSNALDLWDLVGNWGLAQEADDIAGWAGDGCYVSSHWNPDSNFYYIALYIVENGSEVGSDATLSGTISASTDYFITVTREDGGGGSGTGQYKAYIRTESHGGALQDTLSADSSANEQNDFTYLYGVVSENAAAGGRDIDGYTDTMEFKSSL
ncbi:MAG: hypothetical protein ACXADH_11430 [Candidatus Kariarchaeaceae archaeon]|jgi:hypothetical protein